MGRIQALARETFASLAIRNYRLYFIGQGISLCGNWMQTVGISWLVLVLTGSGTQLGGVLAVHYLPVLVLSPFTGIIVDRFNKRHILYITQSALGLCALAISVLVFTDSIALWMVYVFALITGIFNAVDHPTRQTFVHEMVGPENLRNAVTLGSTEANVARAVGPLIAGFLIAGIGIAFCFFINAFTFIAVLVILRLIRTEELHKEPSEHGGDDLFAVFRYVASIPDIRNVLLVMAVIGTFSYEFPVSLSLLARNTFLSDATSYAYLFAAMGLGSVAGGLFAASRKNVVKREFVTNVLFFGAAITATALMPTLLLAIIGMFFVGWFSINLASLGNTMIQLASSGNMRGRVMSLWSMANFGSTLIGAPIIGAIAEYGGARWGLATGGVAAVCAALFAAVVMLDRKKLFAIPSFIQIRREEAVTEDAKMR